MNRPSVTRILATVAILAVAVSASFAQPKTGAKAKPFPKSSKAKKAGQATKKSTTGKSKAAGGKTSSAKGKKKAQAGDNPTVAEWKSLDQRRRKIGGELRKLKNRFSIASRADKLKIKKQFETVLDDWTTKVEPRMRKLAFGVFASNPDNDMALGMVEQSNRYAEIAALTEKLINTGHARREIVRAAHVANFRMNEFGRAKEILEAAAKKSKLEFYETRWLDDATKHVELWKKEEDLRAAEAKAPAGKRLPRVRIETSRGVIEVVLFENEAPNTVASFLSLVDEDRKFYDGVRFHHVDDDAYTGDPDTKEKYDPDHQYGLGKPGYTIKCECFEKNARLRFRGSIAMHHFNLRDSGGSQFTFVRRTEARVNVLPPSEYRSRTVFGYVVKGMEVVDLLKKGDTIKKVEVLFKRAHPYKPKTSLDKEDAEGDDKKKSADGSKSKKAPAPPEKSSGKSKKSTSNDKKSKAGKTKPSGGGGKAEPKKKAKSNPPAKKSKTDR